MSQAVRDLPDPLDPLPSLSTSDPDDLLSKMADEAIDRLIADADNGRLPTARPPTIVLPPTAVDAAAPEPDAVIDVEIEPDGDDEHEPAYPPAAETSGIVADRRVVAIDPPGAKPADTDPADAEIPAGPLGGQAADELHVVEEPAADAPAAVEEPGATVVEEPHRASDREALLTEPARRPSVLLLPLRMLNWPFVWIGDNARRVFGLIGVVTLVPAIAAIVYVLWLKQRWGG